MSAQHSHEGTLQRGKACLSCRRRKMKCDGGRPICGQCMRGNRMDDCEYTDIQGRTRTQILEENVARLQARIQELENPQASSPSVLLHDPYSSSRSRSASRNRSPHHSSSERLNLVPVSQSGPVFPERSSSVPAVMAWWELEEPPLQVSDLLVKQFLQHASQLSFVLNISRFFNSLSLPTLHPDRPHPALLHAIYLWALHISRDEELMQHESVFLQRAILALQDALSGDGANQSGSIIARKRVHAIQAEVLLSQYFFCQERPIEGRYHANAAVSLAISCGLHRIHSEGPGASSSRGASVLSRSGVGLFDLAPPRDVIELGERVNVFWAVYCFDRCFSVATGSPSIMIDQTSPGSQIDTPWPLDMQEYEMINSNDSSIFPFPQSTRTVQVFLSGRVLHDEVPNTSFSALRSKASALFERAFRLVATWKEKAGQPQAQASIQIEMTALARTITQFARGLTPVDRVEGQVQSSDGRRILLLVHCLAHDAMIRLHEVRDAASSDSDLTAANACLVHATEILRVLEYISNDAEYANMMDAIIAYTWLTSAKVFVRELSRARRAPQSHSTESRIKALDENIKRFRTAIAKASYSPVIASCAARIQDILQF